MSINDAMGFWVISRRATQESLLKGSPRRSTYRFVPSPKTMTYAGLQSNPAIEFKEMSMQLAGIEFLERDLVKRVMRNIRRPAKGEYSSPRWIAVMNTFGVGSSVAWALCKEFELDPEEVLK